MDNLSRRLIAISGIWIFFVFSFWYFSVAHPGIGTRWTQEPTLPENADLLKLGPNGEILAQGTDGKLYELSFSSKPIWDNVSELTENIEDSLFCSSGDMTYIVLPPPGRIKSHLIEDCVLLESGFHLEVVLLENGEVWSWTHSGNVYIEMLWSIILLVAFSVGALLLLFGFGRALVIRKMK